MTTALVLRTCNADGTSYNGFRWPLEVGAIVEAPDWNPKPECGGGLHGLLDGWGNWSLLSSDADAVWQIVEVVRADCVEIDDKVKFPRCTIRYSGHMAGAMTLISNEQIRLLIAATKDVPADSDSSGDSAQIGSSGYYARIGSSGHYARIGSSGHYARIGSSGHYAQIGSSGDSAQIGSSGDSAQIGSSGYYARIGSSGENSIVAAAGYGTTVSAGNGSCFCLPWYDEEAKRPRMSVAYVGENGIEPNVLYRLDDKGNFVRADK